MKVKKRNLAVLIALFITLTVNQAAHAGLLKKFFIAGTVVGVSALAIYKAGQASERKRYDEEASLFDASLLKEELERLESVSNALWRRLENNDFIDSEKIINQAKELRRSADISMLDTAAFAYAELGDKQTALEIYEYRIFPKLVLEDQKTRTKYEKHYAVLRACDPQSCLKLLFQ